MPRNCHLRIVPYATANLIARGTKMTRSNGKKSGNDQKACASYSAQTLCHSRSIERLEVTGPGRKWRRVFRHYRDGSGSDAETTLIVPELRSAVSSLRSRQLPWRGRLLTPPLLSMSWTVVCMAGFQVILHGRYWVFTEDSQPRRHEHITWKSSVRAATATKI